MPPDGPTQTDPTNNNVRHITLVVSLENTSGWLRYNNY